MLLTVHLLLLLIISASGQQERDQACTMLIVVDQVAKKDISFLIVDQVVH